MADSVAIQEFQPNSEISDELRVLSATHWSNLFDILYAFGIKFAEMDAGYLETPPAGDDNAVSRRGNTLDNNL
jgi:hypothetical protein